MVRRLASHSSGNRLYLGRGHVEVHVGKRLLLGDNGEVLVEEGLDSEALHALEVLLVPARHLVQDLGLRFSV